MKEAADWEGCFAYLKGEGYLPLPVEAVVVEEDLGGGGGDDDVRQVLLGQGQGVGVAGNRVASRGGVNAVARLDGARSNLAVFLMLVVFNHVRSRLLPLRCHSPILAKSIRSKDRT